MITPMPAQDPGASADELVRAVAGLLDEMPLNDPASVEHAAALMLLPLEAEEVPDEAIAAYLEVIEQRRDPTAAAMLAAIAALGRKPVAALARAGTDRLGTDGIISPLAPLVGTLSVADAWRLDGDGGAMLLALLRRPRTRRPQVALLEIENDATGGALVSCMLTPPLPTAEVKQLLLTAEAAPQAQGPRRPISPNELAELARKAAARAVEVDVALAADEALGLPVIARALTGDAAGLARPEIMPPWDDDDPELVVDPGEDEDHFEYTRTLLLDELEEYARETFPPDGPVWRSGDSVALAMLDWKGGYGDGLLGRWTTEDLAEFLLDYWPRKVMADAQTVADVPECVVAFLGFLADRDSLSGEPLTVLEAACVDLTEEFAARVAELRGSRRATSTGAAAQKRRRRKNQHAARRRNRR